MKKILLAFTCIFTLCTSLFAKNDTYIYDFWSEYEKSADAYRVVGNLENSDFVVNNTFWVGVYPGMTDAMIDYMAQVIKEAVGNK